VDIYEINSGINLLSHKTKAIEYSIISKLLFTAFSSPLEPHEPIPQRRVQGLIGINKLDYIVIPQGEVDIIIITNPPPTLW